MKIFYQAENGKRKTATRERGVATIILILLLAIMMILIMAESRALIGLRREVKLVEQQQIKRLNGNATNVMTTVTTETK